MAIQKLLAAIVKSIYEYRVQLPEKNPWKSHFPATNFLIPAYAPKL